MSSDEIVIDVQQLCKRYEIYASPRDRLKQLVLPAVYETLFRALRLLGIEPSKPLQYFSEFWALHDVSFRIRRGQTVGILGLNGSGKSTLLQLICSILTPTSGSVTVRGRVAALLELGSGFNPDYTGRENVFLNGKILGLSHDQIEARFHLIEKFADIGGFIDQPIKTYSSGMVVRLAFAVAINVEPEILVVDEALAVGDLAFQRKCFQWMDEFARTKGVLLFVSHSPEQVRALCSTAIYLRQGEIAYIGDAKEVCERYEKDLYLLPKFHNQTVTKIGSASGTKPPTISTPSTCQPYFAECAIHYGGERAKIIRAWLEDTNGAQQTSFKKGDAFRWCYQVIFNADIEDPVFGFMIKTKEGINLFAANSQSLGQITGRHTTGSTLIVRFSVEPRLGVGEYFINCAVSTIKDSQTDFLCRVIDAGMFTVNANGFPNVGIVDMNTSMHISLDQPHSFIEQENS